MKESLIRESVIRSFIGDLNTNLKSVEEELIKLSNKINKRQINGLIVCKINTQMEEFELRLPKKYKNEFMKLSNNINNYFNDMLVD